MLRNDMDLNIHFGKFISRLFAVPPNIAEAVATI